MSPRNFVTLPAFAESRIASLVQAYHGADYRWELDGRWLPLAIGAIPVELEAAFPLARSFGLLSAWNPHSVERAEPENRADDEALSAALADSGLPHRPGFSSARNRSWREPSWVVMDMPLADFDALARRFRQLGTLHSRRGEPMRLRMYHGALSACPGLEGVDWVD